MTGEKTVYEKRPHQRGAMRQLNSHSQDGGPVFFLPLFNCCSVIPDPVLNYSKKDRCWTDADPFDASHPSIALGGAP